MVNPTVKNEKNFLNRCYEEYTNTDVKQHNMASMHVTGLKQQL